MNFKEYYVKHPEEIDYVDFYVVKDFGKMALTPKNALLLEKGTGAECRILGECVY